MSAVVWCSTDKDGEWKRGGLQVHWLGAQVSFHSHKRPLPLRVSKNAFGRIPPPLPSCTKTTLLTVHKRRERERERAAFLWLPLLFCMRCHAIPSCVASELFTLKVGRCPRISLERWPPRYFPPYSGITFLISLSPSFTLSLCVCVLFEMLTPFPRCFTMAW